MDTRKTLSVRVSIIVDMETLKLEIVQSSPTIVDEIHDFMKRNQDPTIRREVIIDSIVEGRDPVPIPLRSDIFGSTYQSSWRSVTDLKSVSHTILEIEMSRGNIYGMVRILRTPMGNPLLIDGIPMILRPIYYDLNRILTFDIDFKTKESA